MKTFLAEEHGVFVLCSISHESIKISYKHVVGSATVIEIKKVHFHAFTRTMFKGYKFASRVFILLPTPFKDRDGKIVQFLNNLYICDFDRKLDFTHLYVVKVGFVGLYTY